MIENTEINEEDLTPLISLNSTLKPMLLLFGSWVFAYLLGVSIHEIGHALATVQLGYTNIRIYLHPFELNYVTSTLDSSSLLYSISGPLFNLLIATILTLVLWKFRNQYTLPILMLGPAAFISEGVAMIIEATAYPHSNADWVRVVEFGMPYAILWILAFVTIALGCFVFLLLVPVVYDVQKNESRKSFFIILSALPGWYLLSVIYSSILDLDRLVKKIVTLASSILLVILFTFVYERLFPRLERISRSELKEISWISIGLSLSLAVTIIIVQFLTYYLIP
ncbi:MAG: hypothetical protein ACTSO5_04815 [Candidatus Heimdallarchaeaceae archaeon]